MHRQKYESQEKVNIQYNNYIALMFDYSVNLHENSEMRLFHRFIWYQTYQSDVTLESYIRHE